MSRRWKYLTVEVSASWTGALKPQKMQEELDKHGAQGWELVNIVVSTGHPAVLVFKKEI
ncbi:DUF4177 domain-containing protein [Luteimonas gilva]|uniref:DUF4177 domain-containing protein n=1 Tax=Luteimonas gilva TaxID=2572684 RepID=A0A4U5JYC4_9GAMM|nr:DUF4177 domain-containing protein [Luteimonas gilva]TKR33741.1 DUF4177 domain-containing protein [Luteimonas gilva]